jgi:hypothetical protein
VNYFFDSSALIKLYHPELGSQQIAAMFGNGGFQFVEEGAAAVAEPGRVGAIDPVTDFGNGHRAEHDGNFSNYFLDTLDSLIWPQIPALGGNQDTGVQN